MKKLRTAIQELDKDYSGYYYKISDILTVLICGALCGLQNISDIYEWSKAVPVREFLFEEFQIRKFPSRAQFYNIIGCVDSENRRLSYITYTTFSADPMIRFETGSVLTEGAGMEHNASFNYGYKIPAVRDRLFEQSKYFNTIKADSMLCCTHLRIGFYDIQERLLSFTCLEFKM